MTKLKRIKLTMLGVAAAGILLLYIAMQFESIGLGALGACVALIAYIGLRVPISCPNCEREIHTRAWNFTHCPYCGKPLEEESDNDR